MTGYDGMIKYSLRRAAVLLVVMLTFCCLPLPAAAGDNGGENTFARTIELTAPDIASGESMVRIGNEKYIRYSISLSEYKTLLYSDISFDIEFDDSLLTLYTTNINLQQIYAYDAPANSNYLQQRNIVYYEPQISGSVINCSAYSTTGMWFRGPVIILYFLPADPAFVGRDFSVMISNFTVSVTNADGNPENMTDFSVGSRNGVINITEERTFLSGETMPPDNTSPLPGRGYGSTENTGKHENSVSGTAQNPNIPLLITITVIVVFLAGAVLGAGIRIIFRILRLETKRKADRRQDGKDEKN